MRKTFRRKKTSFDTRALRFNEAIRVPMVSLIDEDGQPMGEMETRKALYIARERGYDLVEVSPKEMPPVVKLIDYGEFKYKKEKQEQKKKISQKKIDVKGIRLSLRISKHDIELRKNKAKEFIEEGHKVKIDLILKGREREHKNLAFDIILNFIKDLGDSVKIEQPAQTQGGLLTAIITKK
ncbi:MAG: translation initiation factor IF-3 [bacterium]